KKIQVSYKIYYKGYPHAMKESGQRLCKKPAPCRRKRNCVCSTTPLHQNVLCSDAFAFSVLVVPRIRLLPTRNDTFFRMLVVMLPQESTDPRLLRHVLTALWQFEYLLDYYDGGKVLDRPLSSRQVRSQVGQLYRRIFLKPRPELMRAIGRLLPQISIA